MAYEYDVLDRPAGIVWRKSDGDTLRSFGYAYDMAGNITNLLMEGEALPSRATAYGYDMLDRLTDATTPGRANAWSYDLAGNRTSATHSGTSTAYTLGVGDRLASTSADATYLYSAAGCVTNISVPSVSSVVSLSWNSQYQLTAAYTNGALAESYQYDALNRRVATTTGGTTTCHVYDDNWQVLADLDASGRPLRSYTWGPGIDNLLAVTVYGEAAINTYYALTDHLGTVHALVDSSGAIAESYEYDAWGKVLAVYDASGSPISNRQSAIGNRYLFQGREYSYATGLCHFRMRWYDPATGRWLSNDPIGISGGLNQYVFCNNNPVNRTASLGLQAEWFPSGPDVPPGTIFGYRFDPAPVNAAVASVVGKVWNAPNTALGLAVGLAGVPFGASVSLGHNGIMFEHYPWMAQGGLGLTLGNATLYKDDACKKYEGEPFPIGEHEEQHTYQGELLGPFYLPAYLYGGFRAMHRGEDFFGPAHFMEAGPYSVPPRIWK